MKRFYFRKQATNNQKIPVLTSLVFIAIILIFTGCNLSANGNKKSEKETDSTLTFRFDLGPGKVMDGYTGVKSGLVYNAERGYGFCSNAEVKGVDTKGNDALKEDYCTSTKPFCFAVDVPEGNYDVTLVLGAASDSSVTTVKAESRRLMLEKVVTAPGEYKTVHFTTNVRYPAIKDDGKVSLKSREIGHPNWDHRLSMEFSNTHPAVCAITIKKNNHAITVYLAGNSTVTDQQHEPWAAWGQMLPRFFEPGVVSIANNAESGETLKAFVHEGRLKKLMSTIKSGDYLFIQFAHNDQKPGASHVDPFTSYKEYLKMFIDSARSKGATPVLVTSMHRRRFDDQGHIINTLGDYPEAMRQTAKEENVALIDLNAMSRKFFEAMGPDGTLKVFVHYPAGTFPGQDKELADNTHFNNYGAYELAKCVVEGIKETDIALKKYLKDGLPGFDPAHPDPVDQFELPHSAEFEITKPEGN